MAQGSRGRNSIRDNAMEDKLAAVTKLARMESKASSDGSMSLCGDSVGALNINRDESPIPVPHGRKMTLEDQLTHDRLRELEMIFAKADTDGGGSLDTDEFRAAVRHTMGDHLTDQELDALFMKVDTNCDGTVDWNEYLSYMLLEYKEKDAMTLMTTALPLPKEIYKVPNMNRYQRHHDTIVRIRIQPNISKHANNLYNSVHDSNNGKYITISKDGILNFWNMKLKNLRKHKLPPPKSHSKNIGLWVTDLVCAPNLNMIIVSSTSGNIVFYDLTAYTFEPVLVLADLEICVTCMTYWVDPGNPSRAKLLWGDVRGNIAALVFDDCPSICFLQPTINKDFKERVEFSDLLKQTTCGVTAYHLPKVHEDLVIEIKYLHSLHECFISCCRKSETSLFMSDLEQKRSAYFEVMKGVRTFDYSSRHNMIITAGRDSMIRTWNPYFPYKPLMTLQGTKSPILFVFVHEETEHIYSVSQEKEIHVFDMNTQMCIQTLYRKWVPLGVRIISASVFNVARQALLIGSNELAMFEHKEQDIHSLQFISHTTPITHVLYNELFDQVVSAAVDSLIVVWDAESGERSIQFQAHLIPQIGGGNLEMEITSMVFDPTQRRLITSARDGIIKIWNHNNGGLLRQINIEDTNDIAGIICLKERIMTAGWNRRITIYIDSYEDDTSTFWKKQHHEDVTAMTYRKPSTVASASYDGDILLWMFETGHVTLRFNVHLSTKPIALLQDATCSELDTDTYEESYDESESTDESVPSESDFMNEDEDDEMLKQFMAYNTHRASIAAPIPNMPRRMSTLQDNDQIKIKIDVPEENMDFQSPLGGVSPYQKPRRPSAAFGSTLETIHDTAALTLLRPTTPGDLRVSSSGSISGDINKRRQSRKMSTRNQLGSGFDLKKHLEKLMNDANEDKSDDENDNENNSNLNIERIIENDGNPTSDNTNCLHSDDFDNTNNNNEARFRLRDLIRRDKMKKNIDGPEIKVDLSGEARARYDDYLKKNEASILKLVFLENRESDNKTATLVSAASGGWIRFWAVEHTGGLIGQFNAAHHPGESVQAICVDKYCEYLFTGDTEGYIKVWDITEYCINEKKIDKMLILSNKQQKYEKFPLITQCDGKLQKKLIKQSRFRPPPLSSDPDKTWFAPELLNSFKGHMQGITGIDYIDISERIVSCSTDCSVRMFTIYGQFIGIFGQGTPWCSQLKNGNSMPSTKKNAFSMRSRRRRGGNIQLQDFTTMKLAAERKVPNDVRSVASATTLRVLNDGIRPPWKLARNILLVFLPLLKKVREKRKNQHRKFSKPQILLPEATKQKKRKSLAPKAGRIYPWDLNLEGVQKQLQVMEQHEYTSDILGMSYKPFMKHKPFPQLPKIRQFQNQCDVYSSLPFFELAPTNNILNPPEAIIEVLERSQLLSSATNHIRAGMRRWRQKPKIRKVGVGKNAGKNERSGSTQANTATNKALSNQRIMNDSKVSMSANLLGLVDEAQELDMNKPVKSNSVYGRQMSSAIMKSSVASMASPSNMVANKQRPGIQSHGSIAASSVTSNQSSRAFNVLPPISGDDI